MIQQYILLETGLRCFYCDEVDCSENDKGKEVECQMRNPLESHYGDYCAVGHSGEYFIDFLRHQF